MTLYNCVSSAYERTLGKKKKKKKTSQALRINACKVSTVFVVNIQKSCQNEQYATVNISLCLFVQYQID